MSGLIKKPSTPKTLEEAVQVINQLWAVIEQLIEQRDTDSSNSSKPPSSDGFRPAKRRTKPRSKRSQGAQPGHPKHERRLFPESEADSVRKRSFPTAVDLPIQYRAQRLIRKGVFPYPWRELVHPTRRMFTDPLQHIRQIYLRVHAL